MCIKKVSPDRAGIWKMAVFVLLLSTTAFLIIFIYNQIKVSETPCEDEPCKHGGTCIEVGESFNCFCSFGYSGSKCEDSPCSTEPCFHDGSCTVNGTSYMCSCQDGYNGTQCEETPCSDEPCLNNGSCETLGASHVCNCPDGYNGTKCEVTPCFDDPCLNGGTCSNKGSSYLCSCLPRYTGISCEEYDNCGIVNDCADNTTCPNGIYELNLTNITEVYCNMEVDDGGWIVFQRRFNGKVYFYRKWNSYKYGFGDLDGEFWLGNEVIHEITKDGNYMLRIDLEDFKGETRYALYSNFEVEDANSEYTIRVSGYSGNAGDGMALQNNRQFSTKDRNNIHCAQSYKGAWWYNDCHSSNLNGLYLNGTHSSNADGVEWVPWTGLNYSLKKSRMMIRRK